MAQIQIWTRDVNTTEFFFGNFTPQHTFLIKVNDDGTREILRGGPIEDDMLLEDLEIINQSYNWDGINESEKPVDWYDPTQPNTQHFQGQTIKDSSQSEIDSLWNSAKTSAESVSSQFYDYEPLSQNCNTVTAFLARVMGLENEVNDFLTQKNLHVPGLDKEFDSSPIDQIWDSFDEAMEYGVKQYLDSLIEDAQTISTFLQSTLESFYDSSLIRRVDPLSLDLDGDGIELVNVNSSTAFFDLDVTQELDGNGNPTGNYISDGVKEQVGWVSSDDGILTLDKNSNGTVDNILELFGRERRRFISGKTHCVLSECGQRSEATRAQARVVFERSEKSDEALFSRYSIQKSRNFLDKFNFELVANDNLQSRNQLNSLRIFN